MLVVDCVQGAVGVRLEAVGGAPLVPFVDHGGGEAVALPNDRLLNAPVATLKSRRLASGQ